MKEIKKSDLVYQGTGFSYWFDRKRCDPLLENEELFVGTFTLGDIYEDEAIWGETMFHCISDCYGNIYKIVGTGSRKYKLI